ncbi:MAG: DUF1292 domain-containing protein [Lachnospiraceae bacterium]|nr:DUF1292 domain-containing protein [Lachnospiraceae bacterium]
MGKKNEDMDDEMYVTLQLDNQSVESVVITIFEAGGRDYIALLPTEQIDGEEGEVFIYRYSEDEQGNPSLENIQSDEEFEIASDRFDEWLDEQEYEEMIEE